MPAPIGPFVSHLVVNSNILDVRVSFELFYFFPGRAELRSTKKWYLVSLLALFALLFGPLCAALPAISGQPGSFIVQAADMTTAAARVRTVGGELTHQLGIINAVGARLTAAQRWQLQRAAGLQIYENRAVRAADGGSTETVRDEFSVQSYSNNDGTVNWAGDWIETNDYGGATGGDILVSALGRLRIRRPGKMIHRGVYLPTDSTATLSFGYQREGFTSADHFVALEVSGDGGATWTQLDRFVGPASDGAMVPALYRISSFASPNTVIRFATSGALDGTTFFFVDDVQVEYTSDLISIEVIESAADSFGAPSYDNNDGTILWSGNWVEGNDDGTPLSGYITIHPNKGELIIAELNHSIQREVDLSGASAAEAELRLPSKGAGRGTGLCQVGDFGRWRRVLDRVGPLCRAG